MCGVVAAVALGCDAPATAKKIRVVIQNAGPHPLAR